MESEGGGHQYEGAGASAGSFDDTVVEGRTEPNSNEEHRASEHAEADDPRNNNNGVPVPPSSFRAFDRSGINKDNPFQSNKRAIFGVKAGGATGSASARRSSGGPVDRFAEREAARRREREDELYFNAKYAVPSRGHRGAAAKATATGHSAYARDADADELDEAEEAGARSDADYAFLRRTSTDLPLHRLNSGQRQTARELAEEHAQRAGRAREATAASGGVVRRSASATRASDEELLGTIDYLESFLERSKHSLTRRRSAGPEWARQLELMGGPERAGRMAASVERDELFGRDDELEEEEERERQLHQQQRLRASSSARPGYAAPTVSSSPFGHRASPFAAARTRPRSAGPTAGPAREPVFGGRMSAQEEELARLESQVADLRRQAAGIDSFGSRSPAAANIGVGSPDRDVAGAMDNIRQREELERSIAYLQDYTQGRRPPEEEEDEMQGYGSPQSRQRSGQQGKSPRSLSRSASERLYSPFSSPPQRVPSTHPHRTGKNHVPSSCVYCQREVDWNSWNTDVVRLVKKAFPEKAGLFEEGSPALSARGGGHSSGGVGSPGAQSRLRPLAHRMYETSKQLSSSSPSSLPISRDVDSHFLSQLSAAERRNQSKRLDSLWYMVGAGERDKKAQMVRIAAEIEAEQLKRQAHMRWLEEQAVERALKKTLMDRSQEREVQRLLQDQARHVARLLDLKRQSLANYTRDQLDLVAEKSRIERETQRLRRQNDRHSLREMQRQVNESVEKQKQRKLDQIRHSEEKYSFRISQLKRPVGAQRGINDLAYWRSGRE